MRRWMMWGVAAAACMAAAAQGQSAPQASVRSDSWERPAASSSAAAGTTYASSSSATSARAGHGTFRFKDDDKTYDPRFQLSSPKHRYGRPDSICEANPTASTCRQASPPRPGQGF